VSHAHSAARHEELDVDVASVHEAATVTFARMGREPAIEQRASGRCECGGVSYTVVGPLRSVWNCHCHRCRRFTGHHMAATAAAPDRVRFTSDTTLT
jgi:hypothetical protein